MSEKVDGDHITAINSEADFDLANDVDLSKDEDWSFNFFESLVILYVFKAAALAAVQILPDLASVNSTEVDYDIIGIYVIARNEEII